MDFFTKQTKALILTGQLRLRDNQNPIDKINQHIDYFKPDYTYLFLWDYEYQQYGELLKQIPNSEIIVADPNKYIATEYEMQHLILQLRKYLLPSIIRREEKWEQENTRKAITAYMLNPSIKQQTFSQINFKHSNYILSRYDIVYIEPTYKLQLEEIYQLLDSDKPTIATPYGGDAEGIGLGDLVIFSNKKAAKFFTTFYDNIIQDCVKQIAPSFPEGMLRYIFSNIHNSDIYRFNFPCTTQSCEERNFILHPNIPHLNIVKNNAQIPIAKYPTNVPEYYKTPNIDLPLIPNPIM